VLFCVCGVAGQLFIFYGLENLGSIALVTITVTRKLVTILFSLLYYNHSVSSIQWVCVTVVFAAIISDGFFGQQPKKIKV